MNRTTILYGLFNPLTTECFYIGKTDSISNRLKEHIKDSKYYEGSNYQKEHIIREILKAGSKPIIAKLLEVPANYHKRIDLEEWHLYEMYFIKYTRDILKQLLTNISKGGDSGIFKIYYTI